MRLGDYLLSEESIQWQYARQVGVKYAIGRMPDGKMDETAASFELLKAMKDRYTAGGFDLKVIEPAPPNQKIKQNLPGRDEEIENMCTLIRNMGKLGIEVLCYNFATHFNWSRTDTDIKERGGALVTGYDHSKFDHTQITEAGIITADQLWKNFEYMQKAIVPVAEEAGVMLALHPDDPPVDHIQNVARILNSPENMEKAINICPSKNMGITMCQGTFVEMGCDIYKTIEHFGKMDKIFNIHFRDTVGDKFKFHETFHDNGPTDMAECVKLYEKYCPDAFVRVDHVPTMAGEQNGKPGYEYLGRLFAIGYLKGLMEMERKV